MATQLGVKEADVRNDHQACRLAATVGTMGTDMTDQLVAGARGAR
jgi:hypothetical protein